MSGNNGHEDRLYQIMAEVLGVNPAELTEQSSPDSVAAWDSLNHLNLAMAVEGEFAIDLSADDILEMRNVAFIRTILSNRGVEV